jgi:hypothetical protein
MDSYGINSHTMAFSRRSMSAKATIAIDTSPFFDGPKDSFHILIHLYHVACVVHGLSACGAYSWGLQEKDIALTNLTFDKRMPKIKVIVVVVWICTVLELGLTESCMFVWVMIRAGGIPMIRRLDFDVAIDRGFCRW